MVGKAASDRHWRIEDRPPEDPVNMLGYITLCTELEWDLVTAYPVGQNGQTRFIWRRAPSGLTITGTLERQLLPAAADEEMRLPS